MSSQGLRTEAALCAIIIVSLFGLPAQLRAQDLTASCPATPPAQYGFVSSEFTSPSELEAVLPMLAARGLGVILDWSVGDLASPARFELVRNANAQGVTVYPWLLLSEELGYWAGSTNAVEYDQAARALIDGWLAAGLAPSTLVIDMEMPIERARRFAELVLASDTGVVVDYLRSITDRAQYARATAIYSALVDYAHSRGFLVEVSTWSQVLDDYGDGDDGLRQGFNIPIDQIAWDTVSFQAYRTLNQSATPWLPSTTSYFVFDYALRARALFGARAGILLGMTHPGDLAPDASKYLDGDQLREDLDAVSWAGIDRSKLGVYNLRGILDRPPMEQWFPAPSFLRVPPPPDLATGVTHLFAAALDANL